MGSTTAYLNEGFKAMSTDHNDAESPPPTAEPPTVEPRAPRPAAQSRIMLIGVGVLAIGAVVIALRPKRRPNPNEPVAQGSARDRQRPGAPPAGSGAPPNPNSAYPEAGPAELALVAPLAVGEPLGDSVIVRISRVQNGFMHVISRKNDQDFHLAIGLAHEGVAATRVGRYAVYVWGSVRPDPAAFPVADALANILRPNVDVPPPPGMTAGTFGAAPR